MLVLAQLAQHGVQFTPFPGAVEFTLEDTHSLVPLVRYTGVAV